jgi:predicted aldo/keto reductase-like oxidoreductase
MLYRKMNNNLPDLSIPSSSCMRLPVTEKGKIDEPQATMILRYPIDHGVNYKDTA